MILRKLKFLQKKDTINILNHHNNDTRNRISYIAKTQRKFQ